MNENTINKKRKNWRNCKICSICNYDDCVVFFLAFFILSFLSFAFGYLLLYFETAVCFLWNECRGALIFFLALIFLIVTLFCKGFNFLEKLKSQRIHNQCSTIKLIYVSIFLAPFVSICLFFALPYIDAKIILVKCFYWNLIIRFSFILTGYRLFHFIKSKISWEMCRFAPNATTIDELGFDISTTKESNKIAELKDYINVVALYGEMGSGKSSFSRMIIEKLPVKKTLYTYISLTETNEAKSFSKLFSERWFETLNERYPLFNVFDTLTMMSILFRETNNNSLAALCNIILKLNFGIQKTKAKVFDDQLGFKPEFVSKNIASLFSFVPIIKEKRWIIVVDEIERAKFDEIYRVIEAIERFKAEGRNGLPVQITFILCISRNDLENSINKYKEAIPEYFHIKNFFIDDQKSFTRRIFLPPISYKKKIEYIENKLEPLQKEYDKQLTKEKSINIDIEKIQKLSGIEVANQPIINILTNETPRIIKQTIAELEDFYNIFDDSEIKCLIKFSDILALSFIRVKYSFLIDFFRTTIEDYLSDSNKEYLKHKKKALENPNKEYLKEWIKEKIGHDFTTNEYEKCKKLIKLVANFYIETCEEKDFPFTKKGNDDFMLSTSFPDNLRAYLCIEQTKT